jgi:tyrosyl-tRNA synthetase
MFVPLISSAQGHLLGKSQEEVRTAQKDANCPFVKTAITKLVYYDRFHCGDDLDMLCYYRKETCWKVAEVRKLNKVDTMRRQLNASAQKVKKDRWVNKTAGVKIQLTAYKRYNEFFLDYTALDK